MTPVNFRGITKRYPGIDDFAPGQLLEIPRNQKRRFQVINLPIHYHIAVYRRIAACSKMRFVDPRNNLLCLK